MASPATSPHGAAGTAAGAGLHPGAPATVNSGAAHLRQGHEGDEEARHAREGADALDPLERRRAQLAPPPGTAAQGPIEVARAAPPAETGAPVRAASLEELLPQLVRRIAWSTERGRGTVRLEVGTGALAGAVVTVHADGEAVRVHLAAGPGVDTKGWQERVEKRLRARGVHVTEVEVS